MVLVVCSLVRNSVVLAVYLLFSVVCFFTVHEHLRPDCRFHIPPKRLITPQMPSPAPRAITKVCNTPIALLKNSIRSSLSAACSAALKNFFKKCRLIRRLHLHPTGQFHTGQNFRPVRLPAAVSGAGWIRTCPPQRYSFCPRPQGTCSAGAL